MDASRFALALFTLLATPLVATASAQATPMTLVIVGVSDAETGEALNGAQIFFPGLARSALTDGLGEARATIPSGIHRIRVRFLGYSAVDTMLTFVGDTSGVVFPLPRTPSPRPRSSPSSSASAVGETRPRTPTTMETIAVKATAP